MPDLYIMQRGGWISIHALRVEGDGKQFDYPVYIDLISIHALRVEGDQFGKFVTSRRIISIHALRVEGDMLPACTRIGNIDFYPRPPGGGRQKGFWTLARRSKFLSTPSGWRATRPQS